MKKKWNAEFSPGGKWRKMVLVMKLKLFILTCCVQVVHASAWSQEVRMDVMFENEPLTRVVAELQERTGYEFFYLEENLADAGRVTVKMTGATLEEVLAAVLRGTGLTWEMMDGVVVIRRGGVETRSTVADSVRLIRGRVVDEKGVPLPGVTVLLEGTTMGVATDANGQFEMVQPRDTAGHLVLSFVGMKTVTVRWEQGKEVRVTMEPESAEMDEVVVTGYQRVDRRKSTAAVSSKKIEEIMIPGATSLDQMLMGQIPDMMVMSNSGEVGVVPKLRIRGTSTLIGNREPLWVVDGIVVQDPVEIAPEELNDPDYINRIGNAIAGLNPQDIDRIDVLKDAAATALYGTKAANGVIVITTKKGRVGRPIVTYAMTMTLRQRPSYKDRNVNVMNSKERIQFSKELLAEHYAFPDDMSMVGYEGLAMKLYNHELSEAEFNEEVAKLEVLNTDWFDLLTKNSLSHQHTLSISGGSDEAKYYASIGYMRDNDVIWDDNNERYTAALNLDANLTSWLTASLSMNGNVSSRDYYQEELAPMDYAYTASRTIPAYTEEGDYYFYDRKYDMYNSFKFNIMNELDNSSHEQTGSALTVNTNLQFNFMDWLNANLIASYSTSHTTIEGWWGDQTYHAALLRGTDYGTLPKPYGEYYDPNYGGYYEGEGESLMPYGGELNRQEMNNTAYTIRLQMNANKNFGKSMQHNINGALGFEMNSSTYEAYENTTRGYYKDRGMSFVTDIDLDAWPYYADWIASNVPVITNSKENTLSAYASVSYSYYNYFTANVNGRVDGSNGFGDQSNDKLLPIWSASANWNISEHSWMARPWIDLLRLKFSFGYQGNMLSDQTPVMIISKQPTNTYFNENTALVERYPNPELKWETTTSYNLGLEFSLFQRHLSFEGSLYWKHTKDAFMQKKIASMNGVLGNSYVVNGGDMDNKGYSVAVTASPVNTRDFRWTLSTSWSQTFNKLKSDPDADMYELENFLDGSALVKGEAIGTFYSYKFLGLSPVDGVPVYDDGENNIAVLKGLSKYDTYTRILEPSGQREPTISGSLNTTLRYKNFRLSGSFAYSLGNKIRLFAMYNANSDAVNDANEIRAENNASKDYLNRWRHPGDELKTDIPAIITPGSMAYYKYSMHWSRLFSGIQPIANTIWDMYDYGNNRVVSGNYLKCSNISVTYEFGKRMLEKMHMSRLALTLSGANLFTIAAKELKGQTPTQSGFSSIQLSDRPNFSFGLTVSF